MAPQSHSRLDAKGNSICAAVHSLSRLRCPANRPKNREKTTLPVSFLSCSGPGSSRSFFALTSVIAAPLTGLKPRFKDYRRVGSDGERQGPVKIMAVEGFAILALVLVSWVA